jgi:hypothetical protein
VILAVEPVIGLHRYDGRAQLARVAHQGPCLDAERLGRVAGGDRHGALRQRLHDDDGLAAQGRVFLLLARREEGVEIEEQPLDGRLDLVHGLFYIPILVKNAIQTSGRMAYVGSAFRAQSQAGVLLRPENEPLRPRRCAGDGGFGEPAQRRRRGAWGGRPCAANAEETASHVLSGLAPGRIPRYPWVQCSFMFLNRSGRM